MNTGVKITAYAAALAATFGAAYGVGTGVGPVEEPKKAEHGDHAAAPTATKSPAADGHAGHEEAAPAAAANLPGGLQVSDGGYTLALETPVTTAGRSVLKFSVKDAAGKKVTAFTTEHGKELHFIVASRDLNTFRHLHPVKAADGTWTTPVDLPAAGGYKAFADFKPAAPGAKGVTLGADLSVPGAYAPKPLPAIAPTAAVDGYQVRLGGTLDPGKAGELRLTVTKAGKPVTDLEPYLGAYGHLVALRDGDLAYLHVHPNEGGPGPDVSFTATAPSAGTYRLFLDFQHQGKVRTAAFTVTAGANGKAPAQAPAPAASATEHGAGGHAHG
ncbi:MULTISPECIES: hypothetical protein [unclassified Streptomyces]|uniref:hypothetical protein n=1 Tax=unclassified Streptomyces TaxID=2593676 RepID=UPI0006F3DF7A|nr:MULTISPECIES: hypothetical protein [unclassified Streptomyces]KQX59392.1 hypothetical protein ASD33_03685 [Streptomyces sp. Root1304]KRB00653.1 hypothetical protein ASE09_03685 [Streptomyces sp. Root66D1]